MGIQINGNNDIISALDGSWTAEGAYLNTSGIATATTFKGNVTGTACTFVDGNFTGNVTIGGTLTYEDVTNIDSVGLITARDGINLTGGNITLGDSGGNSDDKLVFGADGDLKLFHNGSNNYIDVPGDGNLYVRPKTGFYLQNYTTGEVSIAAIADGKTSLYYNGTQRLATSGIGATVFGQLDIESAGSYIKSNQLKFNPSGHAYIDHGVNAKDISFRLSVSSALDTTMLQMDADGQITKFHKVISVGLQGGNDTAVVGGGSGIGAYLQLNHASTGANTKLMGNSNSWLNANHGYLGIGTANPTQQLEVLGSTILKETGSTDTALQIRGAGTQGDNALISFSNGYTQTFKIGMSDDIGPARDFIISETSTGSSTDNKNPKYIFNGNGDGVFSITDKADGDVKVVLSSNGNSYFTGGMVLIGETSVAGGSQKLVIGQGGAENFEFTPGTSSLNGGAIEYIHRGDSATRPDLSMYVAGGAFKVYTNGNNERLRIDTSGNVHINGTPPWSVSGGNYRNLSISGEGASASGFLWLGNGTATTNADFDLGRINFCNGGTIVARVIGSCQTSANDDGRLTFHTKETGETEAERMRITSTGLLLLGTDNMGYSNGYTTMTIGNTSTQNTGLTIVSSASNGYSRLHFADGTSGNARYAGWIAYDHANDSLLMSAGNSGSTKFSISSTGSVNSKGNGAIFEQVETNSYNGSWAAANGKIAIKGDLSGGNYFGWRQKGVGAGSVTQANAEKKLPTLNDFTYPNSSNGMLIASTSKIGFSASGESPQYASGVRMLYDGDLGLGGSNAYDCNDSVATSTTTQLMLRGNGRIGFHMNGSAPVQAIHIDGGTQTSNRGIYGDWDYGSSTSGQSGANYMLLEDKRWRINRGNPLIHLNAYNNSQNSNGSGGYTSRLMKIDMNTAYTNEVSNDYMYGIDINVNTTNVNQVRALHTNGAVDAAQFYLNDYHMAERYGSDSGNKEWGHWRGCIGGNNGWNGDNRSPRPHDFARGRGMACFFSQKNANSSGNYMDSMHFSTYSDWSGGAPNLFMINKSNNNVRVIRGGWDSAHDMEDYIYDNGTIYDLDYTSGSDLRLKEDINTITSNTALSLVTQLRPVTFKWKDEYINSGFSKNEKENEFTEEEPLTEGGPKRQIRKTLSSSDKVVNVGLIAQEVESVIPTVVHDGHVGLKDEDGANYKNIDYDKLVPYLIGAIKELKSENDALKARVTTLENP